MIEQRKALDLSKANVEFDNIFHSDVVNSNEKLLLILNKDTGLAPYSHEFINGFQDPQVLSGFISALSSFLCEVTGSNSSQWKTVFGSDSIILVEGGDWSVGVLIAERETSELRSKLRSIVREFEDCFEFLRDVEGIENIFDDFNQYVRRVFVDERISSRAVVTKFCDWRNSLSNFALPSTAFQVSKVLLGFEKSSTIQEIAEFQKCTIEEVIAIVSTAYWHGLVKVNYIPLDHDILSLSEKASSIIFRKSNPLNLPASYLRIIARLDGRTPLSVITSNTIIRDQKFLDILGSLINSGFVQRISIERRLVLFNECILSHLVFNGIKTVGKDTMKNFFETVSAMDDSFHPWSGRLALSDLMQINCVLEESMTPDDLDDMYETLEYFIEEITKLLFKRCGTKVVKRLINKVRSECREIWAPYFSDVVI